MSRDDRPSRYEVAPGCYVVSSRGPSRSGSMTDTVRAIVEEADREYQRDLARRQRQP